MPLSRAEADRIALKAKTIGQSFNWRRDFDNPERHRFKVEVISLDADDGQLFLTGTAGLTFWGFTFLGPQNEVIRKISDPNHRHRNPDGKITDGRHKHVWDPVLRDQDTYLPEDIRWGDFNDALEDFVAECNITVLASLPRLAFGKRIV